MPRKISSVQYSFDISFDIFKWAVVENFMLYSFSSVLWFSLNFVSCFENFYLSFYNITSISLQAHSTVCIVHLFRIRGVLSLQKLLKWNKRGVRSHIMVSPWCLNSRTGHLAGRPSVSYHVLLVKVEKIEKGGWPLLFYSSLFCLCPMHYYHSLSSPANKYLLQGLRKQKGREGPGFHFLL